LVSHDRYLIEACADQLWVVADHKVTTYDGDLDDYRRMVLSARGMRTNSARPAAALNARRAGRDQAGPATRPKKARSAEAKDFRGRSRKSRASTAFIAKIDTALATAGSIQSATRSRQPSSARARCWCGKARCSRAEEDWLAARFAIRRSDRLSPLLALNRPPPTQSTLDVE